jgi:hypothetical protein
MIYNKRQLDYLFVSVNSIKPKINFLFSVPINCIKIIRYSEYKIDHL